MCQPGGECPGPGGAVTVQVVPWQVKAGKMVREPIELPCVDEVAPISETRMVDVSP